MDAFLDNLPLPDMYSNLISISKSIWEIFVGRLRVLQPEELNQWISDSYNYLTNLSQNRSSENYRKLCIGMLSLYHFFLSDVSPLEPLINALYSTNEVISMQLAAYCIASIASELPPTNDNFARKHIEIALSKIKLERNNYQDNLFGLFLLRELGEMIPLPFLIHSPNVPEQIWPFLINTSFEIRMAASQVLERYLTILVKYQGYRLKEIFDAIFQNALMHLHKNPDNCPQGALTVLLLILKQKGEFYEHKANIIFDAVFPFAQGKEPREPAISVLGQLAAINPVLFRDDSKFILLLEIIKNHKEGTFLNCIEALTNLINNVPEKFGVLGQSVFLILRGSLQYNKDLIAAPLMDVLLAIAKKTNILQNQNFNLWEIIEKFIFTKTFLQHFPVFLETIPNFWVDYSFRIVDATVDLFQNTKKSHVSKSNAFNLICLFPTVLSSHQKLLISSLRDYLLSKSEEDILLAPKAVLHILLETDNYELHQILHQVIDIATGHDSVNVRVSCLNAFRENQYHLLANPVFLDFFSNLSHDDSPLVRSACFRILKKLREYDPFGVDLILRRSMLESLYSLQCSTNLIMQEKNSCVLPNLVSASPMLMHIFSSTYIPIILDLLTQRFSYQHSEFNNPLFPEVRTQLALSLVQTLDEVITNDFSVVKRFLKQILEVFTAILGEWGDKRLKHQVLATLLVLFTKDEPRNLLGIYPKLLPMVFHLIATCNSRGLRVRGLKFLGLCGAVSPRLMKYDTTQTNNTENHLPDLFLVGNSISYNDYFVEFVWNQLHMILNDKSLSTLRMKVLTAATICLDCNSTKSAEFFGELVPLIELEIQNSIDDNANEALLLLQRLIFIAGQRIIPFVDEIMVTIHKVWRPSLVSNLLLVIASLVDNLHSDFNPFAASLVTNLLDIISSSVLSIQSTAVKCIPLMATICASFPHLSQVLAPRICEIARSDAPLDVKVVSLDSLRYLVQNSNNITNSAAMILRTSLAFASKQEAPLQDLGFQVMYSLILKLGGKFNLYTHRTVDKLINSGYVPKEFVILNGAIMSGNDVKFSDFTFINTEPLLHYLRDFPSKITNNQKNILEHFDHQIMTTPKHYQNWLAGFIQVVIQESPSVSINACTSLSMTHTPLGNALFFPAFLSCWISMGSDLQAAISLKLSMMLTKQGLPPDVTQTLAQLLEYMDRAEKPILISESTLTNFYTNAHCLALALHNEQERVFKEIGGVSGGLYDNAVHLYIQLSRPEAAKSLLKSPNEDHMWLLKLEQWGSAYEYYSERLDLDRKDEEAFKGFITSACKLRRYQIVREKEKDYMSFHISFRATIAEYFAESFIFSNDFNKVLFYTKECSADSVVGRVLRAIALYMLQKNDETQSVIDATFSLISAQSSALFGRRYETVYPTLLNCQVLYELQDLVKLGRDLVNDHLRRKQWSDRLKSVDYTSAAWWYLILVRRSANPNDYDSFIKFVDLILHERKFDVFEETFKVLFPNFNELSSPPLVTLLKCKYNWAMGNNKTALEIVFRLTMNTLKASHHDFPFILSHYVDWTLSFNERSKESLSDMTKKLSSLLGKYSENQFVWQKWAVVNYHNFNLNPKNYDFAFEAIKGYVNCLTKYQAQNQGNFAEIIQLLSLFFATADNQKIFNQTSQLINRIAKSSFIDCLPQLIAQLSHPISNAVDFVVEILKSIAKQNFQPLLFPLLVVSNSKDKKRSIAANAVLDEIAKEHPKLMVQGQKIQSGLLKVAISIFEKFTTLVYKYFDFKGEGNYEMSEQVLNEIKILVDTPQSQFDNLFKHQNFQMINDLLSQQEDPDEILRCIMFNNDTFLDRLNDIAISDVSTELESLLDTEVAVPGSPDVRIHHFLPKLSVMGSKKRPRRVTIVGNNSQNYKFLLKGNEDLRLDQRVMQFFRLINAQIRRDISLSIDNVSVRCYSIVPLSTEVGLIQWVDGCDTFYNLVAEYRISHNLKPNHEQDILFNLSVDDANKLTPMQRLEVHKEIRQIVDGGDLRKVFWLKSPSSEAWLERTSKYARSTALMSIVGYILGLGDRHPSNFMIDRNSGDVIHIDFGDSFDVARNRVLFSEMIPFRLTRMVSSAFGLCGIEGEFYPVSVRVMMLIRENCNSLISVLEIFVQEPIEEGEAKLHAPDVMKRIRSKIRGNDFEENVVLPVEKQVGRLINEALDEYNLAKLYSGWKPLW
ncbi:PIKK family atypical protein kinase [Trichomonas vaginalis G3]|uniref:Serine/threonine-protein kinase TOR n=1 Tax=Trichomonas vaginalis (strain ATCC PRA-98 / G3) TaxID=412133 RepID=A2E2R5_TRIV3|nr:ataxia telangiectasia mutated (ATM) -related family [Trichomonas vaginalis G3]EAY13093.1 PIKK family atypical protein kinase [Trichomonas vaginalis G3]KAI5548282.1 ataxia telangiectasia mutated (ATM) -related family [Trichomonas vaginalis G3]|eukprot:XP_001325316.1 PIKK family atypical protein kinase [Trichomonas vaginalis G3]